MNVHVQQSKYHHQNLRWISVIVHQALNKTVKIISHIKSLRVREKYKKLLAGDYMKVLRGSQPSRRQHSWLRDLSLALPWLSQRPLEQHYARPHFNSHPSALPTITRSLYCPPFTSSSPNMMHTPWTRGGFPNSSVAKCYFSLRWPRPQILSLYSIHQGCVWYPTYVCCSYCSCVALSWSNPILLTVNIQ